MAFGDVLREMHELTGNVEASFTSKMIATLHPDKPIWDNLVLARIGLRLSGTTAQTKLENAVELYGQIDFTPISLTPSTPPKRPPAHASPRTPRG